MVALKGGDMNQPQPPSTASVVIAILVLIAMFNIAYRIIMS